MSRSASSAAQACVRRRGRTLVWPNGVQPIAPKAPPTLPRGPRMSARVTPPLAVHRPPVFRCACTVTGPPRGVSPAKVTALCAVARVVIGTVNLDFFGFFLFSAGPSKFGRSGGQRGPAPPGWPGPPGQRWRALPAAGGRRGPAPPGQGRRALPVKVLRLSAPGWPAVCLAHYSSSESDASSRTGPNWAM